MRSVASKSALHAFMQVGHFRHDRPTSERGLIPTKLMDMSGIEPDPSRKQMLNMLSERDNQLHHMPIP